MLVHDIEFVADHLVAAGADGIDMDTTGAAGDCDFLAASRRARSSARGTPTSASRSAWPASS
jgi:hypothetical protein